MKSILIIDSAENYESEYAIKSLGGILRDITVIKAANMNIHSCIGCNDCWLKTPGICSVKDGFEKILKSILSHDYVLFIGRMTKLGFIDHKLKNIVDRLLPLLTMLIEIDGGQERHVPRYEKKINAGLLYTLPENKMKDGEVEYLNEWFSRFLLNFKMKSIGVHHASSYEEVIRCILS